MDSFLENNIYEETLRALYEQERPSVLFRPRLMLDGNQYMALYGEDLMNGIGGFGDTADLAMRDFDKQWIESKAPTPAKWDGRTANRLNPAPFPIGKCKFCGDEKPLDQNGHCAPCVNGMARTKGD